MRRYAASLQPALVAAALLLAPRLAGACTVCFGDPGAPATKGLNAAVLFLVAVIVAVLAGVALFARSMLRRSERDHQTTAVTQGTDG